MSSDQTGIDFNNEIEDSESLNVFLWNFIYQGAGVGLGDFNNDDLVDIYFCGNKVADRLYINQGNFRFKDVSKEAGIQDGLWSTGVSLADVNDDGLLDIYVCKNSNNSNPLSRRNKLFINKGNLKFSDEAGAYGLADEGFSVQSTFFDADNDGDLDMYLVNQLVDQFAQLLMHPSELVKLPKTDRLFINQNGRYVDFTEASRLANTYYGLNCMASDFNNDGRTDLYVSNDYFHPDQFLVNQSKYRFVDEVKESFAHTSFYSMGADAGDINNDGHQDLIVLDMSFDNHYRSKTNMESMRPERFNEIVDLGFHYQYAFNALHINNGDGEFSDIAQLAGIASTDWSWSPLFADLDNDSYNDLLVTNGLVKDLRNNDFTNYVRQQHSGSVGFSNYQDVMSKLPSTKIKNKAFRNRGNYQFEDISSVSGFDFEGFSTGMAYADLDNDGDLDFVINNTNAIAGIYRNETNTKNNYLQIKLKGKPGNQQGIGAKINVYLGETVQSWDVIPSRGYMSSSDTKAHFGLATYEKIDSVVVIWDHVWKTTVINPKVNTMVQIGFNEKVKYQQKSGLQMFVLESELINHMHLEDDFDDYQSQVLLPHKLSQNGPFIAKADVNGDSREDLFIGSSKGYSSRLYLQNGKGQLLKANNAVFEKDKAYEDMQAKFHDLDQDGDQDLIVTSGSNEIDGVKEKNCSRVYINDGNGIFTRSTASCFDSSNAEALIVEDFNNDKIAEILIGGRLSPGNYPYPSDSKMYQWNKEKVVELTEEMAAELKDLGMVTDFETADLDRDGDLDIIAVGEWMPVTLFENKGNAFVKKEVRIFEHESHGFWWSIEKGDFDNDGDLDLLLGNLGRNNKFGASITKAFSVFARDFDDDGETDVFLAKQKGDQLLPVRGRECASEEMPFILDKFPDYDSYAKANVHEILADKGLDQAIQYSIKNFSSIYLENKGGFNFEAHELPVEAQFGPIKDFIVRDFNADGELDFIFAGNHYPVEVETTRYDGNKGGLFEGDGKGGFNYIPYSTSGIFIDCDARDLEWITLNGVDYLVVACNQDFVRFYSKK
jgi:hypothetical protein